MTLPPTLWPTEKTRCPYCVENANFKLMTKGQNGDWYVCDGCSHIVMPGNKLFDCPCPKCSKLNRSIPDTTGRNRKTAQM